MEDEADWELVGEADGEGDLVAEREASGEVEGLAGGDVEVDPARNMERWPLLDMD